VEANFDLRLSILSFTITVSFTVTLTLSFTASFATSFIAILSVCDVLRDLAIISASSKVIVLASTLLYKSI
jgi:hypothetical protein